jgi:thioredoxin reductase
MEVAVFGKPLNLWREHMPEGMFLRSYWWATNLSDPEKKYGLEQYFQTEGQHESDPFPIERFINYGLWFQKHAIPNVDETYVKTIERKDRQFLLTLEDSRVVQTPAVVMAPGLNYYVYRPAEYDHMPADLVSHTSDHSSFDRFGGKQVAVIGGGQSALETAALLNESGAEVQLVARSPLHWLRGDSMSNRTFIRRLMAPKAGISPGWLNWGLEHFPYVFQRLPRSMKETLLHGPASYGPAGSHWLKDRIIGKVRLHERQYVQEIKEADGRVKLTLSNKEVLKVDHIFLGTGYRADIKKLPMLHPSLLSEVLTYRNSPVLNKWFETNIPGLYFIGFSSVLSCGPLFRFVVGTDATAKRIARAVTRQGVHAK